MYHQPQQQFYQEYQSNPNYEFYQYNQFINENLFGDDQINNQFEEEIEEDMRSQFQMSKNSAFQPPSTRSPFPGLHQMSNSPYMQQPQFYQNISPYDVQQPQVYSGSGSAFLQRAQAINPAFFTAGISDGNQLFDQPSPFIQRQVPASQYKATVMQAANQYSQSTGTSASTVKYQQPSLLVNAAAQQQLIRGGASVSSSSDGDEFTVSKADEINEYSEVQSQGYQSTNVSGVPSPMLADKPLVNQQPAQNLQAEEMASSEEATDEEEESSDSQCLFIQPSQQYFKSAAENDKLLAKFWDISDFKLDSFDLNVCVEALLKKTKDDNALARDIKRRQRKNKEQLGILENEFNKNTEWERDFIHNIAKKLGLRVCQVYKWHWDQRKKVGLPVDKRSMK